MKELSIEEKAKAYDEALEKSKRLYEQGTITESLCYVFPELKELENEKIRGAIIDHLKDNNLTEWAAWIEKQGEQQTSDKIEPEFKVGDWINGYYTNYKVLSVNNEGYVVEDVDGNKINILFENEKFHHLWTIQDAKDGDVLVNQNREKPFIFKEYKDNHIYCHCGYTNRKDIFYDRFVDFEGEELHWLNLYYEQAYPATKEQRDLLFSKMKEAGYQWDAEKKELKKIEWNYAWSEEDESNRTSALMLLRYPIIIWNEVNNNTRLKVIDWLKSLKGKYVPQLKQDWSEEDERRRKKIIHILSLDNRIKNEELSDINNWLKSLRPQNNITDEELAQAKKNAYNDALDKIEYHSGEPTFDDGWSAAIWYLKKRNAQFKNIWKPSDYQLEALESATENCAYSEYQDCLRELIEQLKKLKK